MKRLLVSLGIILSISANCASAATIYHNGVGPDQINAGGVSDDASSAMPQFADNFELTMDATINTVRWWGYYDNDGLPADDFRIEFFLDNGGLPQDLPTTTIANAVIRADSGETFVGFPQITIYEFSMDVGNLMLNAGTTYWLSMVNDTSQAERYIAGGNSSAPNLTASRLNDPPPGPNTTDWNSSSIELAFQLEGVAVPEPSSLLSIVIIPDTQMYVERHPEIFEAQIDWIDANAAAENIIYVAHLGDLKDDLSCDNKDVNNGTGGDRSEWQIVNDGFAVLDAADIPYGVVAGNHDFEQISSTCPTDYSCAPGESETCAQRPLGIEDTTGATFNSVLGPSRFDDSSAPGYQPTYGDLTGSGTSSTIRDGNRRAGTNEDNFSLVDFGGVGFVIINLGYREDDNALAPGETSVCSSTTNPEISWADGLLSDYSDRLGIVTSHAFMDENTNDPGRNRFNNYGASIYACLSDNPNLLMMLSAHRWGESWRREITGRSSPDLPVHALLSDYQRVNFLLPGGGVPTTDVDFRSLDGSNTFADSGFMRIMRFDLVTGVVTNTTFAPPVSFADPVTGIPLTYPDDPASRHAGHWHVGLAAGVSRSRPGLESVFEPDVPVNSSSGRIRFPSGAGLHQDTASNFCFTYRGYRVGVTEPAPDDAACPITFFDP